MLFGEMQWAKAHDWFVDAEAFGVCYWTIIVRCDSRPGERLRFTNYKSLREWAGY